MDKCTRTVSHPSENRDHDASSNANPQFACKHVHDRCRAIHVPAEAPPNNPAPFCWPSTAKSGASRMQRARSCRPCRSFEAQPTNPTDGRSRQSRVGAPVIDSRSLRQSGTSIHLTPHHVTSYRFAGIVTVACASDNFRPASSLMVVVAIFGKREALFTDPDQDQLSMMYKERLVGRINNTPRQKSSLQISPTLPS